MFVTPELLAHEAIVIEASITKNLFIFSIFLVKLMSQSAGASVLGCNGLLAARLPNFEAPKCCSIRKIFDLLVNLPR